MSRSLRATVVPVALASLLFGCNGNDDSTSSSSGGSPSSTSSSTGGANSMGGASTTGGNTAGASSGKGGASSTAGTQGSMGGGTFGATGIGGKPGTGGTSNSTSSATGGRTSVGVPYRGVANSPCDARTALKVSWYYNWMQSANEPCAQKDIGGEFVPMVWGHPNADASKSEQTAEGITNAISAMVSRGDRVVLGFNEPDNSTQAKIPASTAVTLWPAFNNASIRVGSPATQANTSGVAWFKEFNTKLQADPTLRADFIAIHWYGWNAGSCDAKASTLENYIKQIEALPGGRPIWLTEWGCLHESNTGNVEELRAHIQGAVAMFARHPRLERYAWYPWASNHALAKDDGTLTALGTYYASLPAYK